MAKNNYIDNMIKQYGENWIAAMKPEDIQRSTKRIVRDMVKGNIDYEKNGKYFYDPKFLENVLISVSNELEISSLHYNALVFYKNYNPYIPQMNLFINNDWAIVQVYSTIYYRLLWFRQTGDLGSLVEISPLLYQYRNNIV